MSDKNSTASGGIGFTGLLTIAFIVLKLCKVIDWSWWWVLCPVWISVGIALLVIGGFGIYYWRISVDDKKRIAAGMTEWAWKNRKKKSSQISERPLSKWEERMKQMRETKQTSQSGK